MRQSPTGQRLARKELENRQPATVKRVRGSREIDAPDAKLFLADFAARRLGMRLQAVDPVPQRACIVLAQRFRVDELQTLGRKTFDHPRDVRELSTGEYVLLHEVADPAAETLDPELVLRDPVVEHQSTWLEQAEDLAEVARIVANSNVLEHADARDLVVELALRQVQIVEQLHANLIAQAELGDAGADVLVLVLRQRDTGRLDAIVLRGPKDEAAPATADIEQLLRRPEH